MNWTGVAVALHLFPLCGRDSFRTKIMRWRTKKTYLVGALKNSCYCCLLEVKLRWKGEMLNEDEVR